MNFFSAFDQNLFSVALLSDISKVFDTVHRVILLLKKLCSVGFRGQFYDVFENYIAGSIAGCCFGQHYKGGGKLPLRAGVLYGSILSPLLFSLFC